MRRPLLLQVLIMFCVTNSALAQKTAKGTVFSEENSTPLPGVTITVKGSSEGAISDLDGNYEISISADDAILTFSFVGMELKEEVVGNRSVINVSLREDPKLLDEVVVSAFGIKRDKKALGYSTVQVSGEEANLARVTSPFDGLQGKIAGVNISSASGAPGASTKIIIRGYNSITGGNAPLYVIDGVPMDNGFNNFAIAGSINSATDYGNNANSINPDDIESISVLKGSTATALYGSRGANGIILITTKKGSKEQKLDLSFNSGIVFSNVLRTPQFQNIFGQGWNQKQALDENGSWGPRFDGKTRRWGNVVDNSQLIKPFSPLENNIEEFYETGVSFNNSISLSGGDEKSTYFLSYSNINTDGILPTDRDKLNRHTFSFRSSRDFNSKLTASTSINFAKRKLSTVPSGESGSEGATVYQQLIQIPRDLSIVDMKDINNKFYNLNNFFTPYIQNPYYPLLTGSNILNEERLYGNIGLNYKINDGIKILWKAGGDFTNTRVNESVAIANFSNDPNSPNRIATDVTGSVSERTRFRGEYNSDLIVQFSKDFNNFNLSGLVGNNINKRQRNFTYAFRQDLTIDGFYNLNNATSTPILAPEVVERASVGNYVQVGGSYKDFLFLTANYRYDQSSTLPTQNNGYGYYGVSGGLVFSDLLNNKLNKYISYGKLRIAYGRTGNDSPPYKTATNPNIVPGQVNLNFGSIRFPIAGINGFGVSELIGNNKLRPEFTYETEYGAEINFLDNRIRLDASFYNRLTTDLILEVPLDPTSGYTTITRNIGEVENKGVELLAGITPIQTRNFKWDLTFNYSRNKNKVLKLDQPTIPFSSDGFRVDAFRISLDVVEGKSIGEIRGPKGLFTASGQPIVNPNNGYQRTDPNQKESLGSVLPDYTAGIGSIITYKGIRLSGQLDIRKGGKMYSYTKQRSFFAGNATPTTYNYRQPFIIGNSVIEVSPATAESPAQYRPNDVAIDASGNTEYWNLFNNDIISREHVIDRSYMKLRQLSLGYTLSSKILNKTPFSTISINLVGRNLFLWTPASNNIVDPEVTNWGNDLGSEFGEFAAGPSTRSYGFNIMVKF